MIKTKTFNHLHNIAVALMLIYPASTLIGTLFGSPHFLVNFVSKDYVSATAAQKVLTTSNELLPSHPGFEPVLHLYFGLIQDKTVSEHHDSERVTKISSSSNSLQDIQTDKTIHFHWSYGAINEWPLSTLPRAIARLKRRIRTRLILTLSGAALAVFYVPVLLLLWKQSQLNKDTTCGCNETA